MKEVVKLYHSKLFQKIADWFGLKPICAITIVCGFVGLGSIGYYYASNIDEKMGELTKSVETLSESIALMNTNIQESIKDINNTLGVHEEKLKDCDTKIKSYMNDFATFQISQTGVNAALSTKVDMLMARRK